MVTLSDVKRWNAGTLENVFHTVRQRQNVLTSSGDDFLGALPVAGWAGPAADNALSAHQSLVTALDHLAAGVSIVNKTIAQAADAIPAVQHDIANAEDLAGKYGYHVNDDGSIVDTLRHPGPAERARAKQEVGDAISQALRTAGDIDNDLAGVLRQAAGGGFGTGTETTVQGAEADALQESPGEVLTTPPPNGTPSQNAAWWNSLSATGQQILLRDHPDWLGNLDGLPGSVRSEANLARLPGIRARLEAEEKQLQQQADHDMRTPFDADSYRADLAELDGIKAKLASLDAIGRTMAQGNRQLLVLDAGNTRMEAAVAVGNIDTAGNVAVFTPGFTTTVDGSLHEYDTDMNNLKAMSDNIRRANGGPETAAVTWIGYQAPQLGGLVDPSQSVADPSLAEAGGAKLARFYNGIGADHAMTGTPLHLTALGHSYGSTTTGYALSHDTPVNDAILFGSPGQGAQQLNVPAGHLYDEHEQGDDFVPKAWGTLGPSPYFSPQVQGNYHQLATTASTSEIGPLSASHDHGGYLTNQSTSLFNMAAVTTGHPELAKTAQPSYPGGTG